MYIIYISMKQKFQFFKFFPETEIVAHFIKKPVFLYILLKQKFYPTL